MRAGVGHQPTAMEDLRTAEGARAQGADGVHSASWGNPRGGGRAGGRLKSEIKVMIGGDRRSRLGGDVVTFEDMREFLVAYSEYEQHLHITTQDGGDQVFARRRELADLATQMMVADGFMASPGSTFPRRSFCKGAYGLLALTCSRRVMRIFATRYPCGETGCKRAGR